MTTVLIGISVGLGALVVLLLALLVIRWRSGNSTDERVGEVVASLNARMDELRRQLERPEGRAGPRGGRRSRARRGRGAAQPDLRRAVRVDRPRRGAVA